MIESVTVTNETGDSLELILSRPELSGFVVKSIDGLGPVNANINMTELATLDGAIDNSARLNSREVNLSLRFLETPTIEDVRLKSYKFFPIKKKIRLTFKTSNRHCYVEGRVEKNEPDIFSKEEGCSITVKCADPFFYYNDDSKLEFFGIIPEFEFPFENDSLEDDLLEFGEIQLITNGTLLYEGDSDTGVEITIHALGSASGIIIYNEDTREMMSISDEKLAALTGSGIKNGDTIVINTGRAKKSITLIRGGNKTNILNSLEKPIGWFKIFKGYNTFAYTAVAGLSNLTFTLSYKLTYEGI